MRVIRSIPAHELSWHRAREAETAHPHEPAVMLSGCSTPPIRLWVCGVCARWERTTHAEAPICVGGFAYSFRTRVAEA